MRDIPTIYLIRHGETEWSISGQHTGSTEVPLTAHGEQQARVLGEHLRGIAFTAVLISPRLRAKRTYELTRLSVPAKTDDDLAEWNYGSYEGLRSSEIEKDNPKWNLWTDGCPDGERPDEVAVRADRVIERLRALSGNVAVFSHGHFCCALAVRWIGLHIDSGQHFTLAPASLSVLSVAEHHTTISVIKNWNTTFPT
jgi:broad specificity phosphatase PhoE